MSEIQQYLESAPQEQQEALKKLHKLFLKLVPECKPYIQTSGKQTILGYGKHSYETKSGCSGDWFYFGIASLQTGISVYVVVNDGNTYVAETYADRLKAKVGRSCIRFKKAEDIDYELLAEIIEDAKSYLDS